MTPSFILFVRMVVSSRLRSRPGYRMSSRLGMSYILTLRRSLQMTLPLKPVVKFLSDQARQEGGDACATEFVCNLAHMQRDVSVFHLGSNVRDYVADHSFDDVFAIELRACASFFLHQCGPCHFDFLSQRFMWQQTTDCRQHVVETFVGDDVLQDLGLHVALV